MKTILYKVKLMLFIIMLLVSVMPVFADEGSEVPPITLNVKAGELRSLIPQSKKNKITNLKLIGELKANDIMLIREMGGCPYRDYDDGPILYYDGILQHLDISDTKFVGDEKLVTYTGNRYGHYECPLMSGERIFSEMKVLQTIKLPKSLTKMGSLFLANCSKLVSITLPSSLKEIDIDAIDNCYKLTSLLLDTDNPYYSSEGSVLFNKDKTELVFAVNLTNYVVPKSVLRIGKSCFKHCNGLTSLTLPSGLTEIGDNAFSSCRGLTSLNLPSGLKKIGSSAFSVCSGLTSLTLPSGLTKIGDYAFSGCSGLTSLTLPSGLTRIGKGSFRDCSGLTSIVLPSGLTEISDGCFRDCSGLTSIVLPFGLTRIGENSFRNCSGLTSLNLPSGLTEIGGGAFYNCSGLTSLSLSSGLTKIGRSAFYGCSGLTSLAFPSGLTEIGNYVFSRCSGLISLTFPSELTEIGNYAFSGCSSLTSLTFPSGLTEIGEGAFSYDSNLRTIYALMIAPPVIGKTVFYEVTKFATLYVPVNSYTDYWLSDGWGDFKNIKTFDPTPVESVLTTDKASELSRYNVYGQRQGKSIKGLNIVKMSDGSVKKIMVQ